MSVLKGEIALVTGASRGIGRAIALELAASGAAVVINYRASREDAENAVDEIKNNGGTALACQADVSEEADVRRLVRTVVSEFRQIDILVCNAGLVRDKLIGTMSTNDWDSVIQTNLRSVFLCIREVLPHMMARKHGSIISLSSIAAERGGRGHSNYVAAKGGINAMTKSLAVELARKGIRVNAVSPGIILTEMTRRIRNLADEEIMQQIPMRRYGEPEEVAKAVCFLASPDASYITGEILHVTGGFGV